MNFQSDLEGKLFPCRSLWLARSPLPGEVSTGTAPGNPPYCKLFPGSSPFPWTCSWESHTWLQPKDFRKWCFGNTPLKWKQIKQLAVEPRKTLLFLRSLETTCSKPPLQPLINALAHTETHVHTNAQQLGCRARPWKPEKWHGSHCFLEGAMAVRACSPSTRPGSHTSFWRNLYGFLLHTVDNVNQVEWNFGRHFYVRHTFQQSSIISPESFVSNLVKGKIKVSWDHFIY